MLKRAIVKANQITITTTENPSIYLEISHLRLRGYTRVGMAHAQRMAYQGT